MSRFLYASVIASVLVMACTKPNVSASDVDGSYFLVIPAGQLPTGLTEADVKAAESTPSFVIDSGSINMFGAKGSITRNGSDFKATFGKEMKVLVGMGLARQEGDIVSMSFIQESADELRLISPEGKKANKYKRR